MYQSTFPVTSTTTRFKPNSVSSVRVERLTNKEQIEVLEFLNHRPIHTVSMVGFIRDNGIVSPLNRGTFYSCRNRAGQLEGVALIGHATLLETTTERALEAFAEVAKEYGNAHLIMGELERVGHFWSEYQEGGQEMRLACREVLFELQTPCDLNESIPGLRPAIQEDLDLVVPIQAQLAFEESGVNPLENDEEGFRARCARRIHQGRTWVVVESGTLIFKADVVSETDEVAYLEGIWVDVAHRGKKIGLRCLSQLSRSLLARKRSICLLVNEKNTRAQKFYQHAGFKSRAIYDTIFLSQIERQEGETDQTWLM